MNRIYKGYSLTCFVKDYVVFDMSSFLIDKPLHIDTAKAPLARPIPIKNISIIPICFSPCGKKMDLFKTSLIV